MKTYQYIIKNQSDGIEQGEIEGKDRRQAELNLSKERWDNPYTLLALADITLDKAIVKAEKILKTMQKRRRQRK